MKNTLKNNINKIKENVNLNDVKNIFLDIKQQKFIINENNQLLQTQTASLMTKALPLVLQVSIK